MRRRALQQGAASQMTSETLKVRVMISLQNHNLGRDPFGDDHSRLSQPTSEQILDKHINVLRKFLLHRPRSKKAYTRHPWLQRRGLGANQLRRCFLLECERVS